MVIQPKFYFKDTDDLEEEFLKGSLDVYNWLESKKKKGDLGVFYEINPDSEKDYTGGPVHGRYSLYSGSAGTGFYLIRLYEVTGDESYLEEVKEIAAELIGNVQGKEFYEEKLTSAPKSDLPITGWHTGIYSGPTGAGLFLLALYEHVRDESYRNFAKKLGDDIVLSSNRDESGLYLTEDIDVFSDGGFVLYFISLYKATGILEYIETAADYAGHIFSRAVKYPQGGIYFYANEISKVGMPQGSIYPGFAHGTAGIGFIFAVLYEYDHKEWELEAARETAVFLDMIADKYNGGRLIPYIWREETVEEYYRKYYLGFCHGPAGTSLLYKKLYEITGNEEYLGAVKELAEGIILGGAPEYNSWGLWNSYCSCCGTPGLIEYYAWLYELTKDEKYLDIAKRAAVKTLSDMRKSGAGKCFFGHWDRTDPQDVQTYTGLYIGASGAAANLLKLYAVLKDKNVTDFWEYSY